jgi:hypothetical protein
VKVICPYAKVCSSRACKIWNEGSHAIPHEKNSVCKGITCNEYKDAACIPYEEKVKEENNFRRIQL